MAELSSDTVLRRAPSLSVDLGEGTIIRVGKKHVGTVPYALTILEEFAQPIAFSQAVKNLSAKTTGAQAWIELVSSITSLYKAGALVDEDGSAPVHAVGWSAPMIHVAMLNDHARTQTFLRAIEAAVRPGDVVVDIGTGTGVLAVAAARAGARHVYAIEATEIGQSAEKVFAANGFADRITLLPGWSSRVVLPERATVLVAEIIGNDPLEENVMEVFADARKRFLAPNAIVIPSRVRILCVPIAVDRKIWAKYVFSPEATNAWKQRYGIDFESLPSSPLNRSITFPIAPHRVRDWPQLSAPIVLADLDLSGSSHPVVNESAELTIDREGMLGGLLVYFELEVAPGELLSTSPAMADETNSWSVKIWTSGTQTAVHPGDKFKIAYQYRVDSSRTRIEMTPITKR